MLLRAGKKADNVSISMICKGYYAGYTDYFMTRSEDAPIQPNAMGPISDLGAN